MKKFLIALFTFLLVFLMCPQSVLAAEQKTYDNLADLSTDSDKKDYFVWHDKTDDHIYILFYSNVFNLSNTWEGDDHMYDYYGIGFITDDLINFTKTEAVWDKYNTTYKNDKTNIEFIYSTKEIKNTSTDTVFLTAGYQSSYKPSDNDTKDDTEEDNSGLLSNLWGTVKDIFKSIGEGVSNILNGISNLWLNLKTALSGWFNDVIENIKNIPSALADWFDKIIDHIKNIPSLLSDLWDTVKGIPDLIISGLKSLILPDKEYFSNKKLQIENSFSSLLGFDVSSVSEMFNSSNVVSTDLSAEEVNYNIHGIGAVKVKGFDNSFLIGGINKFKPFIRGFVVLMLVFFNFNNLLNLIGQSSLTSAAGMASQSSNSKGGKNGA